MICIRFYEHERGFLHGNWCREGRKKENFGAALRGSQCYRSCAGANAGGIGAVKTTKNSELKYLQQSYSPSCLKMRLLYSPARTALSLIVRLSLMLGKSEAMRRQ